MLSRKRHQRTMNNPEQANKTDLAEAGVGLLGGGAILFEGIHMVADNPNVMMLPSGIAVAIVGAFAIVAGGVQYSNYFRQLDGRPTQ